jgi:hypothetical protein
MTDKQHFELLVATIVAGLLASWDRGGSGRIFDYESIVDDARECAKLITTDDREGEHFE